MTELVVIEYEQPLAKVVEGIAEAERIAETFAPHFRALRAELPVAMAVQPDDPSKARAVRLVLRNIRTASEKDRKALKESSLRTGKAIDGAHALLEKMLLPAEDAMRAIEEAEERREAARKQALVNERSALLAPFCDPRHFALGDMPPEQFASLLAGQKAAAEASKAAAESARLAAEQAERDRAAAAEADRAERHRLWLAAKEATEAKERADAAAAKERQETEAKIARAQAEADQLRRQQEAREKAEQDRIEAEVAKVRAAAAAPDAEKLGDYLLLLGAVPKPQMVTEAGRAALTVIEGQFEAFAQCAFDQIDHLTGLGD